MPRKPTPDLSGITADSIDRVVAFIPPLEALAPEQIANWGDPAESNVIRLEPEYDTVVKELMMALRANNFVQPFDWGEWSGEAEKLYQNPHLLSRMSLETCVKLLTLHVRRDRFNGGHFGEMVRSGHIKSILRRLQDLRPPLADH